MCAMRKVRDGHHKWLDKVWVGLRIEEGGTDEFAPREMLEVDHAIGGSERGFTSREGDCILEATLVEYIWSSLRLVLTTLKSFSLRTTRKSQIVE